MTVTNQLKKYIQSLHTHKHRQKYNKFIAEGPKICKEFLICNIYPVDQIFCLHEWYETNQDLIGRVPEDRIHIVKSSMLQQLSTLKTANKVLLVLNKEISENNHISTDWSLYLSTIQDPGNMGTMMRTADWFGIKTIYSSPETVDYYNPKVVQAAMGAHNRLDLQVLTEEELLGLSVPTYGLSLSGTNLNEFKPSTPGCICIGNESKGLSPRMIAALDHNLKIPAKGGAESLNASVACGIAIHLLTGK